MISRRRFLKLAGVGAGAVALSRPRIAAAQLQIPWDDPVALSKLSWNELYGNPAFLGRVVGNRLRIFNRPSPDGKSLRNVYLHYIGPVQAAVHGERYDNRSHSSVWYYMGDNADGEPQYIHSAFVVPAKEIFNQPELLGPDEWFWGEITVPIAYQFKKPRFTGGFWDWDYYKCYYGQVHQVLETATDTEGNVWYRIYDDIEEGREAWVLSTMMRRIARSEFEPINPHIEDKRVVIDLGAQTLAAYENNVPVFKTRIASGTSYVNPEGVEIDFSTPYGVSDVQGKRPSRRMRGGESFNLPYDVNGVPWVTYFSFTGAAIHGAFWHNNYGLPRSHGCINVTADAAKWIYRWTQPYVDYDFVSRIISPDEVIDGAHTPIEVV